MMARWKRSIVSLLYRFILLFVRPRRQNGAAAGCVREITTVCMGGLGDFIVFCDAARQLYERGYDVDLICRKGSGMEEVAALANCFRNVIPLDYGYRERIFNLWRLGKIQSDVSIVCPVNRHIMTDIYVLSIQAKHRALPDTLQGCGSLWLKKLADQKAETVIPVAAVAERERYAEYLSGAGLPVTKLRPYVLPDFAPAREQKRNDRIAVFPGAEGSAAKRWPEEKYAWVLKRLNQQKHISVVVLGTGNDRKCCDRLTWLLQEAGIEAENLCGRTSIPALVRLLRGCSVVLSNDSGGAHLSAACRVPTVIILGGWEYGRFYPDSSLPENCVAVLPDLSMLPCVPCGESRPACGSITRCVAAVKKETVLDAVHGLNGQ